jgi:hypothetical protein
VLLKNLHPACRVGSGVEGKKTGQMRARISLFVFRNTHSQFYEFDHIKMGT